MKDPHLENELSVGTALPELDSLSLSLLPRKEAVKPFLESPDILSAAILPTDKNLFRLSASDLPSSDFR